MPKPLYYEDRDVIVATIMELVDARMEAFKFESQIKDNEMRITPTDEFWDDELMYKIDDLFDDYSMGDWRNYN